MVYWLWLWRKSRVIFILVAWPNISFNSTQNHTNWCSYHNTHNLWKPGGSLRPFIYYVGVGANCGDLEQTMAPKTGAGPRVNFYPSDDMSSSSHDWGHSNCLEWVTYVSYSQPWLHMHCNNHAHRPGRLTHVLSRRSTEWSDRRSKKLPDESKSLPPMSSVESSVPAAAMPEMNSSPRRKVRMQ